MAEFETPVWNGSPPNGQGMYHWLVNKDHGRHVVAWFDLHEWTAFGKTQSKQEIAEMYDYLAPCDPPTTSSADRFAAIMWDFFIEGCSIDGVDLQEALIKSGLAEERPATAKNIEGKWTGEIEVGDSLTFLTPEGKVCVNRGAKDV